MPTGYTQPLSERDVSLADFAMRCAHAFGALVTMREDGPDVEPPAEFKVPEFYYERLKGAQERIAQLANMTLEEAGQACGVEFIKEMKYRGEQVAKIKAFAARHAKLLAEVQAWEPPSEDHQALKDFMLQQLDLVKDEGDASYYTKPVPIKTAQQWLDEQRLRAFEELEFRQQSLKEEESRVGLRNGWLKALRASLV